MVDINDVRSEIIKRGFRIEDYHYPTISKNEMHFAVIKQDGTTRQMVICKEGMQLLCQNSRYDRDIIVSNYLNRFEFNIQMGKIHWDHICPFIRLRFINKLDNVFETDTSIDFGPIVLQAVIYNELEEKDNLVTVNELKKWGMSFKEVLRTGRDNMLEDINIQPNDGTYIVSDRNGCEKDSASSASILFADELFTMCREQDVSLILIPSSLKEFVAVPLPREQITVNMVSLWTNILREANLSIPNEVLANDVFYYDNVDNALFFGDKTYTLRDIKNLFE